MDEQLYYESLQLAQNLTYMTGNIYYTHKTHFVK